MPNQPTYIEEIFLEATRRQNDGDFLRAEQLFNDVLAKDPNHLLSIFHLGQLAGRFGKFDIAKQLFERVLALDPDYAEGYRYLGYAHYDSREFEAAIACLERALELQPDIPDIERVFANLKRDYELAKDADYALKQGSPWKDGDSIWEEYGGNQTLVVIFSGFGVNNGNSTFMFHKFLSSYSDVDRLFLRDNAKSWYFLGIPQYSVDVDSTVEFLRDKISGYDRTVFLGCSSGGTAAILYGELLGADKIVAFSPQTVLTEDKEKQMNDHRWSGFLQDARSKIPQPTYLDLRNLNPFDTDIDIYFGGRMERDSLHAAAIEGENVRLLPQDSDNHIISLELRDSGKLKEIVDSAIAGQ
jgi:tetratricopeptide (TPR) repeat protein